MALLEDAPHRPLRGWRGNHDRMGADRRAGTMPANGYSGSTRTAPLSALAAKAA